MDEAKRTPVNDDMLWMRSAHSFLLKVHGCNNFLGQCGCMAPQKRNIILNIVTRGFRLKTPHDTEQLLQNILKQGSSYLLNRYSSLWSYLTKLQMYMMPHFADYIILCQS